MGDTSAELPSGAARGDDAEAGLELGLLDTLISSPGETIRDPGATRRRGAAADGAAEGEAGVLPRIDALLSLQGELGRGGLGAVLAAVQHPLERPVAVKRPHPEAGDEARRALLEEARIIGRLEHPNIVPVHALGADAGGAPLLVMKRIEGRSWRAELDADPERRRLDAHLGVLAQVVHAVRFAHAQGVLHLDLKPENVMLGAYGEVYLVDWGLALDTVAVPEGPLPVAGTPSYMAPETLHGRAERLDARTDVFLLGGLLHYVLGGRPPHPGKDVRAVLMLVARAEPCALPDTAPPALAAVSARALAREPADRFGSAAAFGEALSACLRNRAADALSAEAEHRAAALVARLGDPEPPPPSEVYERLGAVRFGFRQAAEIAEGGAAPSRGLAEALGRVARFELEAGRVDAAAALAVELEPADAELDAAIEAARAARARETEELAALRTEARALDPRIGSRRRGWAALIAVVVFTAVGVGLAEANARLGWGVPFDLGVRGGVFAGALLMVLAARSAFGVTVAASRLAGSMLVVLAAPLALRLLARLAGTELVLGPSSDLVLFATGGAVAAILVDRRLRIPAALCAVGATLAALWPARDEAIYAATLFATTAAVAGAWVETPRQHDAAEP